MKKNILYLFIILIVGALQQSCERDDICIDATTPHLIFRIYDKDKPTQLKKINQLKVTIIDAKADTIRFSNTDSIALPIKVDTDITKYKFISNTNTIVRIDTINLSYTREDVFSISGRGTVATGRIERGTVSVGEEIEIVGIKDTQTTTVTGVEMFRKEMDKGEAGDNCGILLRGIDKEAIERGMVLCKKGSITPHTKFTAEIYVLSKEEGGRHTPFFNNYRPQFYVRTTDVTGSITLPEGTEMVMPGDNVKITVELIAPIAMEEGTRFAIREGGRTVGAGVVASIEA